MLATVLVGRPRLTALNADFAPEAVVCGLARSSTVASVEAANHGVCQASRVALDAPCAVPTFSEVLTRIQWRCDEH